jgi:hypothetical protein
MFRKVTVGVSLFTSEYGKTSPIALVWEDGRIFKIDKVISVKNCLPKHVGSVSSEQYEIKIGGSVKLLYYENYINKWFVEVKIK